MCVTTPYFNLASHFQMKHLSDLVHIVFSYLSMEEEKPWKRSCLCWWRLLSNAFTWCFLSSGINSFLLQGCGYTTSVQWRESHCIVIWFCLLIVAFKEALTWSCGGKPAVLCYGFIPGVMSIVCRRWFNQRGARRCKEGTLSFSLGNGMFRRNHKKKEWE